MSGEMEKVVEWWDFIITYIVCQPHQNGMLVNGFGVESAVFHMKPNNYFNGPVNSTVSMNSEYTQSENRVEWNCIRK